MEDFYKELGKRIWDRRSQLSLTREKLSEMAEISPRFLYEIENGKKRMSAKIVVNLAKSLGTDCDTLLSGSLDNNKYKYIETLLSELSDEEFTHAENIILHFCEACKHKTP